MIRANCTAKCRFAFTFLFAMAAFTGLACLGNEARAAELTIEEECTEIVFEAFGITERSKLQGHEVTKQTVGYCVKAHKGRIRLNRAINAMINAGGVSKINLELYEEAMGEMITNMKNLGYQYGLLDMAEEYETNRQDYCDTSGGAEDDADYYMDDGGAFRPADWKRM